MGRTQSLRNAARGGALVAAACLGLGPWVSAAGETVVGGERAGPDSGTPAQAGPAGDAGATQGTQAAPAELSPTEIAKRALAATVVITAFDAVGQATGQGSGFFVDREGVLVTNLHVIDGATALQIKTASGEVYDHVYLRLVDVRRDIAVLRILAKGTAALPFGDDAALSIGERVYVAGNPLGMEHTFSDGLLSARRVTDGTQMLQVTAPISPGSSGGPVLDGRGRVVGVATAQVTSGQNLNLVVPAHYVEPMVEVRTEVPWSSEALAKAAGRPATAAASTRFAAGARVQVATDVRRIAEPHACGWVDSMGGIEGREGTVDAVRAEIGAYMVQVDGASRAWCVPEAAVLAPGTERSAGTPPSDAPIIGRQLAAFEEAARQRGFDTFGQVVTGTLAVGETETITVQLEPGVGYFFAGVCDAGCADLDLGIASPAGEVLAVDESVDDKPVVSVERAEAGTYLLVVAMAQCRTSRCGYGVRGFRPAR